MVRLRKRAYETLLEATSLLSDAEAMFEKEDSNAVKTLSSEAVLKAAKAVSIKFSNNEENPREGILQSIILMPQYARVDALRLLEILKFIEGLNAKEALETAREALEIASALII